MLRGREGSVHRIFSLSSTFGIAYAIQWRRVTRIFLSHLSYYFGFKIIDRSGRGGCKGIAMPYMYVYWRVWEY